MSKIYSNKLDQVGVMLYESQVELLEATTYLNEISLKTTILEHRSIMNEDVYLEEKAKMGFVEKVKDTIKRLIAWIQEKLEPLAILLAKLTMPLANAGTKIVASLKKFGLKTKIKLDLKALDVALKFNSDVRKMRKDMTAEEKKQQRERLKGVREEIAEVTADRVIKKIDRLVKDIIDLRKDIIDQRKSILEDRKTLRKLDPEKDAGKVQELTNTISSKNETLISLKEALKMNKRALSSIRKGTEDNPSLRDDRRATRDQYKDDVLGRQVTAELDKADQLATPEPTTTDTKRLPAPNIKGLLPASTSTTQSKVVNPPVTGTTRTGIDGTETRGQIEYTDTPRLGGGPAGYLDGTETRGQIEYTDTPRLGGGPAGYLDASKINPINIVPEGQYGWATPSKEAYDEYVRQQEQEREQEEEEAYVDPRTGLVYLLGDKYGPMTPSREAYLRYKNGTRFTTGPEGETTVNESSLFESLLEDELFEY